MLTNLVTNPRGTLTLTPWNGVAGGMAMTRVQQVGQNGGVIGGYFVRGTANASAPQAQSTYYGTAANANQYLPVTAGTAYSLSFFLRSNKAYPVSVTMFWVNASNADLTQNGSPTLGTASANFPNAGSAYTALFTAPANATGVYIGFTLTGAFVSGDYIDVTQVTLVPSTTAVQPFDGAYPQDNNFRYTWMGAADASTSTRYQPAMGGTGYTDMSPCPRVTLNASELHPLAVTADLYRAYDGEDPVIVPGGDNIPALNGNFVRTDYYAPFGVSIIYTAEAFDASGASLGFTSALGTGLPVTQSMVTSPYDPKLTQIIDMDEAAAAEITRPSNATVHDFGNRRIVLVESSQLLTGVDMSFWTDTGQQYRDVGALFESCGNFVVVRTPPPMPVPRVFYMYGDPTSSDTNLPGGFDEVFWALKVDEVSAPSNVLIVSVLTYGRYTNAYATYGAVKNAYLTYRDALLNPPPVN